MAKSRIGRWAETGAQALLRVRPFVTVSGRCNVAARGGILTQGRGACRGLAAAAVGRRSRTSRLSSGAWAVGRSGE